MNSEASAKTKEPRLGSSNRILYVATALAIFFFVYILILLLLMNHMQVEAKSLAGKTVCFAAALAGALICFGVLNSFGRFSYKKNLLGGAAAGTAIFFSMLGYGRITPDAIRFSGVVKTQISGTPVAGVQVWIDNVPSQPVVTNNVGHFEVRVPRNELTKVLQVNLLNLKSESRYEIKLDLSKLAMCRLEVPEGWAFYEQAAKTRNIKDFPENLNVLHDENASYSKSKFRLVFARFDANSNALDYAKILQNNSISVKVTPLGTETMPYAVVSLSSGEYKSMIELRSHLTSTYGIHASIMEVDRE